MTSRRRRLIADELCGQFGVSQRRAARALDLPARSSLRYAPVFRDEEVALARRIEELAGAHPRYGYRRIWALPVRERWAVNTKAVRRLYRELGLKVARPRANPGPCREHGQDRNACHLQPSRGIDDACRNNLIVDRITDGRNLNWLSIIDEYTRECLAFEARRGMTAEDIRIILAEVAARRGGPPRRMRSDNGPEFAAEVVRSWPEETGSGALDNAPASPWQNGYAESFHGKLRDEFLNLEEFENEPQAQALGALRKAESNAGRPHSSPGYRAPYQFSATCASYMAIDEDLPESSSGGPRNRWLPLSLDQEMGSRPPSTRAWRPVGSPDV